MKKYIKSIILTAIGFSLLTSCDSELDHFNENPNSPITTTPTLLLSAMEVSTFSTHTGGLIRTSNIFDQHLAGTSVGQLGDIQRYIVSEQDVNNEWNTLYGTTLISGHILSRDFAVHYPYYNGIGQILTAINLGYATDLWGDVPYDEAFRADEGNKTPKYNTQQEIYQRLQTILDEAIVNLSKSVSSNISVPANDDYIFNGNTKKWIQTAYVLKARFALRLTQVDNNAAKKALEYINASGVSSNDDDANTFFPGTSNGLNQWYAFDRSRANYLKVGAYFVNSLQNSNDPRLSFSIALNKPKPPIVPIYVGNIPEDLDTTSSSYIGSAFASATSPVGIVTYAEAKFIEAEAKLRLGQDAKSALQQAVGASVLKITGTAATSQFLASATATVDLGNIIKQKYLALFLTMEPYNDYRRTGFPVLIPNQASNKKVIPLRLPTPSDERQYNPNATVVSNVTTNVWWDKE
ncbi:SusD/RagB family nutrient-binding outer membrane lipoprotein [Flavobacterium sp. LHD-80]|uniref:SusD/RagB family nutrient-binding outer membrane lipoprotein n=1 Tax=Flavobacterium sp. LHD-80 TaxID=3071411 RepID=UPI0027E080D9|nr:SusD/RagB family nutrient-binding outer membrane lipoprotein [Flavobacterium sp. LHD-80]MDQ6472145.1 SusD/RagB family nutrient-binding outer membrane lipoprotein [Flavobacterium sp. LHD-80]